MSGGSYVTPRVLRNKAEKRLYDNRTGMKVDGYSTDSKSEERRIRLSSETHYCYDQTDIIKTLKSQRLRKMRHWAAKG